MVLDTPKGRLSSWQASMSTLILYTPGAATPPCQKKLIQMLLRPASQIPNAVRRRNPEVHQRDVVYCIA